MRDIQILVSRGMQICPICGEEYPQEDEYHTKECNDKDIAFLCGF